MKTAVRKSEKPRGRSTIRGNERRLVTQHPRRRVLSLAAGAAALPAVSRMAWGQAYPARPVRLIVPVAAGGGFDAVARPLANRLSEIWGQPVVVENKAGAGGNIGAQMVAQSAPDGYTLLLGATFVAVNRFLYASPGFDPVSDLAPVTLVGGFSNFLVVSNSSPAKSVREFVNYAKTSGKVTFGSPGVGTTPHLSGELFKRLAGIEMIHVPYRGAAPALADLIPGRIDAMFNTIASTLPQVRSNTVRALGVTSSTRSPFAPDIPTIAEAGIEGFDVSGWYALFMPSKVPADIISKVHTDAVFAFAHPLIKERFDQLGIATSPSTPAQLAALLKSEMEKWGPIIKDAGIKPE